MAESQYDCSHFDATNDETNDDKDKSNALKPEDQPEIEDVSKYVGLIIEYGIVCLYILISGFAAHKARALHRIQLSRSLFRTKLNVSFVIFFVAWGSGNLAYLVLYTLFASSSSLFYIKCILTLTFFMCYFGFTLIVHYRYEYHHP